MSRSLNRWLGGGWVETGNLCAPRPSSCGLLAVPPPEATPDEDDDLDLPPLPEATPDEDDDLDLPPPLVE